MIEGRLRAVVQLPLPSKDPGTSHFKRLRLHASSSLSVYVRKYSSGTCPVRDTVLRTQTGANTPQPSRSFRARVGLGVGRR